MTIYEHVPTKEDVLTFLDDSIRQLAETGSEAKFIVVGPAAYEVLRQAMAVRFHRKPGLPESYQYIPIVVDPFRDDAACVLPAPAACAEGVATYKTS